MLQLPLNISLDSTATLESFYIGENQQLFDNLFSLNVKTEQLIFVSGIAGSGKSHLAQAFCNKVSEIDSLSCVYLPLENPDLQPDILYGMAEIDYVCLDGLEKIRFDSKWQIAIFNLFNEMKESGKNLIVFSQLTPRQLNFELNDLGSRLSSMSYYKLKGIKDEKLVDFVMTQGNLLGMNITIDVANFIVNRSPRDIDSLKLNIEKLDEQSLAHQRPITIPFVKQILNI